MSMQRLAVLVVLLVLSYGANAADGDKAKVQVKEKEVVRTEKDGTVRREEVREVREVREHHDHKHVHVEGGDCGKCKRGFFGKFTGFWTNTVGGNINCGLRSGASKIGNTFD